MRQRYGFFALTNTMKVNILANFVALGFVISRK
jgi:hypothetical protein